MYLSELIGKRVISIKTATVVGIIIGAYVDKYNFESNSLILDSQKTLNLDDLYEVGEVVTTYEEKENLLDLENYIKITTMQEVVTVSGERLGKVKDLQLGKRNKKGEIESDLSTFKAKSIVSFSDNIIIINPTYRKLNKTIKAPVNNLLLVEGSSDNIYENKKLSPTSYDFLIGKKVKAEVSDINRSFVLMAGTLITERVIENARRAGKLSELVSRSK